MYWSYPIGHFDDSSFFFCFFGFSFNCFFSQSVFLAHKVVLFFLPHEGRRGNMFVLLFLFVWRKPSCMTTRKSKLLCLLVFLYFCYKRWKEKKKINTPEMMMERKICICLYIAIYSCVCAYIWNYAHISLYRGVYIHICV